MEKQLDNQKAIEQDLHLQEGKDAFSRVEEMADKIADDMASELVKKIVEKSNSEEFNLSTAILAAAKTLTRLASFMYQEEQEFLKDVRMAREAIVADVLPALLSPQPCGLCEECKNGHPEECIQPNVRAERTTSRFLPVLANMLLEYDLYNKILWMYTVGREESDMASETENESEVKQ